MSSLNRASTLLIAFAVAGCGDPTGSVNPPTRVPTDVHAGAAALETDVKQSVTGFYQFDGDLNGNNFKYAVSAIRHDDGSVSGEFEERVLDPAGELVRHTHGVVTCFEIVGNIARIGGILDHAVNPLPDPIPQFHLIVADNGNGASGARDFGSNARFGLPAQQFCDAGQAFNLEPIDHGNIEIRP